MLVTVPFTWRKSMKTPMVSWLSALCLSLSCGVNAAPLMLEVGDDIKAGEALMVAVYADEAQWLKKGLVVKREVVKTALAKGALHSLSFDDLSPGRYAVAVYVDRNGDGKLGTGMFGIPNEPYGFSGGRGSFGPPDFADAAFELPADGTNIRIELN